MIGMSGMKRVDVEKPNQIPPTTALNWYPVVKKPAICDVIMDGKKLWMTITQTTRETYSGTYDSGEYT